MMPVPATELANGERAGSTSGAGRGGCLRCCLTKNTAPTMPATASQKLIRFRSINIQDSNECGSAREILRRSLSVFSFHGKIVARSFVNTLDATVFHFRHSVGVLEHARIVGDDDHATVRFASHGPQQLHDVSSCYFIQ